MHADALGGQKASDTLELELYTVMSYYVGNGDQTWVPELSLQPLRFYFSLYLCIFVNVCHTCRCLQRPERESDFWTGVTGSCELSDLGAGN